ncbi:MAG: DUF3857 and transglutaminase domain-containing protein [Planctomycetes bacterium]|jgi:hypothetical protein|nr:DUF3857 and transglutaminase domain-containing protein [Planctomycetota bacterium]
MRQSLRATILILLTLTTGCGVLLRVLAIPVAIVGAIASAFTWILVGDGIEGDDAELRASGIRIERRVVEFDLAEDLTYEAVLEETRVITTVAGLDDAQFDTRPFSPETQTLTLEEARVEMPDGRVVEVDRADVFSRPTPAALRAPEFVSGMATTVVFPQLRVGAKTHVRWRISERGRSLFGFNYCWRPALTLPVDSAVVRIRCDAGLPLRHAERGGFAISETSEGGRRTIVAELRNYAGHPAERSMVSPRDVCPLFEATTVATWEEIGARFYEAVSPRVVVTPEIEALAERVAGGLSGLDAARAIHRFVAANVRYVKVYLQQMDGWMPNSAEIVLRRGYGDCKDQFVLLAALLRARGIEAEPVLVDLERAYRPLPLPTPLQFNHCMAYLPQFDLYANPTDPWRDLGILDLPLSGKFVVIAGAGGRVGRTPPGSPEANIIRSEHTIDLSRDGTVRGSSRIELRGRPSGRMRELLVAAGTSDAAADELLFENAAFASGRLRSSDPADLSIPLVCEGSFEEDIRITMGPTVFFSIPFGLNVANPTRLRGLFTGSMRQFPLVAGALSLESSRLIRVPEGYRFASVPEGREIRNAVASYGAEYRLIAPNQLRVVTRVRLEKDVFSPEEYRELETVLAAIAADLRVVLVATTVDLR